MAGRSVRRRRRWAVLALAATMVIGTACVGSTDEPTDLWAEFESGDIVGVWQAEYPYGIEVLVVRDDGTYLQVFSGPDGYLYTRPQYEWHLSGQAEGRVLVTLDDGRWFVEGPETAEWLVDISAEDPYQLYDHRGGRSVVMGRALLLEHRLVQPGDLSRLPTAFQTLNGLFSLAILAGVVLDVWTGG